MFSAAYVADFVGPSAALIGGNLNDDAYIDILDFGVFVWQYNEDYTTGDTTCTTPYPHADVSGDGTVWTEDFTFIANNFLKSSDAACCTSPSPAGGITLSASDGPRTSITVAELQAAGLGELTAGDVNGDGVLDQADIAAWLGTPPPAGLCGDANCDGLVNNGDIDAFVAAISDPTQYAIDYPGCPLSNSDANHDASASHCALPRPSTATTASGSPCTD